MLDQLQLKFGNRLGRIKPLRASLGTVQDGVALSGTSAHGLWLAESLFGEPEGAIERLARAIRLSPLDPLIFRMHCGIAYAHFFAGHYDDASSWAEKPVRLRPTWLTAVRGAAASHALAGRLDPALCISNLKDLLPLRREEDFAKWVETLRKAGLPE